MNNAATPSPKLSIYLRWTSAPPSRSTRRSVIRPSVASSGRISTPSLRYPNHRSRAPGFPFRSSHLNHPPQPRRPFSPLPPHQPTPARNHGPRVFLIPSNSHFLLVNPPRPPRFPNGVRPLPRPTSSRISPSPRPIENRHAPNWRTSPPHNRNTRADAGVIVNHYVPHETGSFPVNFSRPLQRRSLRVDSPIQQDIYQSDFRPHLNTHVPALEHTTVYY